MRQHGSCRTKVKEFAARAIVGYISFNMRVPLLPILIVGLSVSPSSYPLHSTHEMSAERITASDVISVTSEGVDLDGCHKLCFFIDAAILQPELLAVVKVNLRDESGKMLAKFPLRKNKAINYPPNKKQRSDTMQCFCLEISEPLIPQSEVVISLLYARHSRKHRDAIDLLRPGYDTTIIVPLREALTAAELNTTNQ